MVTLFSRSLPGRVFTRLSEKAFLHSYVYTVMVLMSSPFLG
jgi:hypothetical protein